MDKSIAFNDPDMAALLAGKKTLTQRPMKPQPTLEAETGLRYWKHGRHVVGVPRPTYPDLDDWAIWQEAPYHIGDLVRFKEAYVIESCRAVGWYEPPFHDGRPWRTIQSPDGELYWEQAHYRATDPLPELARDDHDGPHVRWRSARTMPLEFSRVTIRITSVGLGPLQETTEGEVEAEGIENVMYGDLIYRFAELWDSIYSKTYSWIMNPWVWKYGLEVVK